MATVNSPSPGFVTWIRIARTDPWLMSLRLAAPVLVRLAFYPLTWRPATRLLIWWMEKVSDQGGEVGTLWNRVLRIQRGVLRAETAREVRAYAPAYRSLSTEVEALRERRPS